MAQFVDKNGVALTAPQISELDIASQRSAAGTPGGAIAGTGQAGDLKNLQYAADRYGYKYTPQSTADIIKNSTGGAFNAGATAPTPPPAKPGMGTWEEYQAANAPKPTAETTKPNVLTSEDYVSQKKLIDDNLAQQKANIEAEYARRQQEQQMKNEEMSATEKAVQFKTGQAGTSYATDQTNRAETLRQNALNQLLSDKARLISAAQNAANQDNWKVYSSIKKELDDNQEKADTLAREGAKDLFDQYVSLKTLGINERSAARQDATATYNIVKDIPEGETQTIDGIKYTGVKKPEAFWTSSNVMSLMQSLPEGQTKTITDPNTKEVMTITGIKPDEPNTQVFHSVNENTGDETFTTIDQDTGKMIKQTTSRGTGAKFKGGAGGGTSDKQTPEEKAFQEDISKSLAALSKDPNTWGEQWNYMYSRYRNDLEESAKAAGVTVNDVLDKVLNKDMFYPKEEAKGSGVFENVTNWAKEMVGGSTPAVK